MGASLGPDRASCSRQTREPGAARGAMRGWDDVGKDHLVATQVVGLFEDRDAAQRAVEDLERAGFQRDQISVALRDPREQKDFARETGTHADTGLGAGATAGTIVGGLAGLLVGIGALAIPGIGPVLAIGPLAGAIGAAGTAAGTAAAGAGIGAVGGGLVGALVGAGIPEQEAQYYAQGVQRGATMVAVRVDESREGGARDVLRAAGARDFERRGDGDTGLARDATVPSDIRRS